MLVSVWILLVAIQQLLPGWNAPSNFASAQNAKAQGTCNGWIIKQQVPDYGAVTIYISDKAIRCDAPIGNTIFVAPEYNLYFSNDYAHKYTHMSRAAWQQQLSSMEASQRQMFLAQYKVGPWSNSRTDEILGQPTHCFSVQSKEQAGPAVTTHFAWMTTAPAFKTAAKILMPMFRNFGRLMPPSDGLPVTMSARTNVGGSVLNVIEWETKSIERAQIPLSKFQPPTDYSLVNDWMQVISAADMDEFMSLPLGGAAKARGAAKPASRR